jgi:seryl-tRNA synthetase
MSKLLQQLEEMHARVAETSSHEEALIKALNDALVRLDDQLLQDVRAIASEHEVRRTAILGELQGLATSIGMFQAPRVAARPHAEQVEYMPSAGDWREATNNIHDEQEPAQRSQVYNLHELAQDRRALTPHVERKRRAG